MGLLCFAYLILYIYIYHVNLGLIRNYVSIRTQVAVEALTQILSAVPACLWCRLCSSSIHCHDMLLRCERHQLLRLLRALHKDSFHFFSGRCSSAGPKQIEDIEPEVDPQEWSFIPELGFSLEDNSRLWSSSHCNTWKAKPCKGWALLLDLRIGQLWHDYMILHA